ncbi:hypothetical protein [Streptomyces fructofermentans]|uniref:Uncharacterized protein n=1 Tax=Streptomyces fructofermentans TaxID=152141 RepID=A0A918U5Q5_9ACTN|nr:hypothetical protein [Streptomyces fructofermentans]GGX98565.1 hypothetical protein GCM10010515_75970 [Streptomyces fructofermentans]
MTPLLPDVDHLVRAAYEAEFPDATVVNAWPSDWAAHLPLLVARKVPGSAAVDVRGLDRSTISVTVCADSRAEASLMARHARRALFDACTAQFADVEAGGYLSHFTELVGPFWQRAGDAALTHSGSYRYEATYQVTTRPHL